MLTWLRANFMTTAALVLAVLLGIQTLRLHSEQLAHARTKVEQAAVLQALADKTATAYERALAAREQWQRDFDALDQRYFKELTHAKADNERLRAAVRAGVASVRLKGNVCPSPANRVPEAAAAGRVEPAGAALDADLQQRVLDLRGAIGDAEHQIAYLQQYAARCAALEVPQ